MGIVEIVSLISLLVIVVGIWVKVNLNIKELQVEIKNITIRQNEYERNMNKRQDNHEMNVAKKIDKLEEINREEHKEIGSKLDNVIEKITDVAVNVAAIKNGN